MKRNLVLALSIPAAAAVAWLAVSGSTPTPGPDPETAPPVTPPAAEVTAAVLGNDTDPTMPSLGTDVVEVGEEPAADPPQEPPTDEPSRLYLPRATPAPPSSTLASPEPPATKPRAATTRSPAEQAPPQVQRPRTRPTPATAPPPRTPASPVEGSHRETAELDPEADVLPPIVRSLRFEPSTVTEGEISILWIEAHDAGAGIRSLSGALSSPGGGAQLGFHAALSGDGPARAEIRVPEKAESGDWQVTLLVAADQANNVARLGAAQLPSPAALRVQSRSTDAEPPQLLSIQVENGVVAGGETATILAEARDEESGVAGISGLVVSPGNAARIGFGLRRQGDDGPWIGELTIPAGAECGEWRLNQLHLTDGAGNRAVLGTADDPRLELVTVSVVSSSDCDAAPPVLLAIDLDPRFVSNTTGGSIRVHVEARDDGTGLAWVNGRATSPPLPTGATQTVHFNLEQPSEETPGTWIGSIAVPRAAAAGTWKIDWLRLQDRARNVANVSPADPVLATATFVVE